MQLNDGELLGQSALQVLATRFSIRNFMKQHISQDQMDWSLIWQVERDICFLYHELAEFPGIRIDLDYTIYHLPYWELLKLELPEMQDDELSFIHNGCLMMILPQAWGLIIGAGTRLRDEIDDCRQIISQFQTKDEKTLLLIKTVLLALDTAQKKVPAGDELEELSVWANQTFVQGYFADKLNESKAEHEGYRLWKRPSS